MTEHRQLEKPSLEDRVFDALADQLPGQVLYNGDRGAAERYLAGLGLELPNRHWHLGLPEAVSGALDDLMRGFGGTTRGWVDADLRSQLGGIITKAPFGPCIVLWDGPEHFSPYRLKSLQRLDGLVQRRFAAASHEAYCTSREYFAEFWAAMKLPPNLLQPAPVITSPAQLAGTIARVRSRLPQSTFLRQVPGFRFTGGRIAQRAYYDSLADCAHLLPAWSAAGFLPAIRVAIWDLPPEARAPGYDGTVQATVAEVLRTLQQ